MAIDRKNPDGRPDLDLDFTFHASDKMERVDVSKRETFDTRLDKADEGFREDVKKSRVDLERLKEKALALPAQKALAEKAGKTELAQKIDRQITHNKRMIDSRKQELQVAYYVGRRGESMDAVNKLSHSGRGRTDVVTDKTIIESTTAENKKKGRQLDDHQRLGKATGKKVVMDAPNMGRQGVQHATRKGVDVVQSRDELHQKVRGQYKVTKEDPEKIKAAQARNEATKERIAALRQEKLEAAQSGDRQKKIDARKHATETVSEMRSEQHGRIREAQAEKKDAQQKEQQAKQQETAQAKAQERQQAQDDRKAKFAELRADKLKAMESGDRQQVAETRKKASEDVAKMRADQHEKIREAKAEQKPQQDTRTTKERYEQIYDRAYQKSLERGASEQNATLAANDRVKHVEAKVDLNAERADLRTQGTQLKEKDSKAHFDREAKFREERAKDLTAQAQREDRTYQGPPAKDQQTRDVESKVYAREFTARTRLDGERDTGTISAKEHQQRSASMEPKLAEYRQQDYGKLPGFHQAEHQTQTNNQNQHAANHSHSSGHSMTR